MMGLRLIGKLPATLSCRYVVWYRYWAFLS